MMISRGGNGNGNPSIGNNVLNGITNAGNLQNEGSYRESQQTIMMPVSMARSVRSSKCKEHLEENYTNFCCHQICMKPLCPDCIERHTQYHRQNGTYPDIQSIKNVKNKCKLKLTSIKSSIEQLCDQVEDCAQTAIFDEQDEGIKKIIQYRDIITDQVHSYFDSLLEKYKKRVHHLLEKDDKLKFIHDRLALLLEDLESYQAKLEAPLSQIDALNDVIKLYITFMINMDEKEIEKQIKEANTLQHLYSVDIIVEESKIRMLKTDLLQYIRLGSYKMIDRENDLQNSNSKINTSDINLLKRGQIDEKRASIDLIFQLKEAKENNNRECEDEFEIFDEMSESEEDGMRTRGQCKESFGSVFEMDREGQKDREEGGRDSVVHFEAEQYSQRVELSIDQENYFENSSPYKQLGYYSVATKKLYLVDPNTIATTKDQNSSSTANNLKTISIQETIGEFHRLVVNPRGEIFTLGGIVKGQEISKVHRFEQKEGKFVERQCMLSTRSSFAAVCLDKSTIIVIGGKRDGQPLIDCERYDISANKWKKIANLNYAACAASACLFTQQSDGTTENKYIFKFGGIGPSQQQNNNYVERYSPSANIWEVILLKHKDIHGVHPLTQKFDLPFYSGCLQISSNTIYIFGGQIQKKPTEQNFCMDFKDNEYILHSFDYIPLTDKGTFSLNPIIHNHNIVAIQNVDTPQTYNTKHNTQKRLLLFNGCKWTSELKTFT